jgi:hypothetical protein
MDPDRGVAGSGPEAGPEEVAMQGTNNSASQGAGRGISRSRRYKRALLARVCTAFVVGCGFALAAPHAARAQTIFTDGFESGSASAWNGKRGNDSYPTSGCRSGRACGAMTLAGGRDQQSILWEKQFTHSGPTFYASAWYRFPQGFTWDPGGQPWGLEHKMMIFYAGDAGVGRVLVNLRGSGTSPSLAIHFERVDPYPPGISARSDVRWPTDGAWHKLEVEIQRVSGNGGRARVWLDGRIAIDQGGKVCGSPCSPITGAQMGAFSNQGSPVTQTFYMDDIVFAGSNPGGGPVEPVPPQPPTGGGTAGGGSGSGSGSGSGGGTGTAGSGRPATCASPKPEWLVCEGFEARNLNGFGDVKNTGVFQFVTNPIASGTSALEARIAQGQIGENYASLFIGDHPLKAGGAGPQQKEIYLRSRVQYGPGFDFSNGKLFIVNAFENWNAGFPGPNSFAAYYVTVQSIGRQVEALLHSKTSGQSIWRPLRQNEGNPVLFEPGRWYDIMLHLKLNNPGAADGVAELYIDGQRKARYTDVNFRDSYTRAGWNHIIISPLQEKAAPAAKSQFYDDLVVSATAINPDTPPVAVRPMPPVLLGATRQ